jgi:hypothetical protein
VTWIRRKVLEIQIQNNPYGICDGQSGRRTIISSNTSFPPLRIIPPMIYNLPLSSRNETTKTSKLAVYLNKIFSEFKSSFTTFLNYITLKF